eukprot:4583_1
MTLLFIINLIVAVCSTNEFTDKEIELNELINNRLQNGKLWNETNEFDELTLNTINQTGYDPFSISKFINSSYDKSYDKYYLMMLQQWNEMNRNELLIYKYAVFLHWMQEKMLLNNESWFINDNYSVQIVAEMYKGIVLREDYHEWITKLIPLWTSYVNLNIEYLSHHQIINIDVNTLIWAFLDVLINVDNTFDGDNTHWHTYYLSEFDRLLYKQLLIPRQLDYYFIFNSDSFTFCLKQKYFKQWIHLEQQQRVIHSFNNGTLFNAFIKSALQHENGLIIAIHYFEQLLDIVHVPSTNIVHVLYDICSVKMLLNACVKDLNHLIIQSLKQNNLQLLTENNYNYKLFRCILLQSHNSTNPIYSKFKLQYSDELLIKFFPQIDDEFQFMILMYFIKQRVNGFHRFSHLIRGFLKKYKSGSVVHQNKIIYLWKNFIVPEINQMSFKVKRNTNSRIATKNHKTNIYKYINTYLNSFILDYSHATNQEYCDAFDYAISTQIWQPSQLHYYNFMMHNFSIKDKVKYFKQWIHGSDVMRKDEQDGTPANYAIVNGFFESYLLNNHLITNVEVHLYMERTIEYLHMVCNKKLSEVNLLTTAYINLNTISILNRGFERYQVRYLMEQVLAIPVIKDMIPFASPM